MPPFGAAFLLWQNSADLFGWMFQSVTKIELSEIRLISKP